MAASQNENPSILEVRPSGRNGNYEILIFTYDKNGMGIPGEVLVIDADLASTETIQTDENGFYKKSIVFDEWDHKYSFKLLGVSGVSCWVILNGNQEKPKIKFLADKGFWANVKQTGNTELEEYENRLKTKRKRQPFKHSSDKEFFQKGPSWLGVLIAAISGYFLGQVLPKED